MLDWKLDHCFVDLKSSPPRLVHVGECPNARLEIHNGAVILPSAMQASMKLATCCLACGSTLARYAFQAPRMSLKLFLSLVYTSKSPKKGTDGVACNFDIVHGRKYTNNILARSLFDLLLPGRGVCSGQGMTGRCRRMSSQVCRNSSYFFGAGAVALNMSVLGKNGNKWSELAMTSSLRR